MYNTNSYNYTYLSSIWAREKSLLCADGETQRSLWGQAPILSLGRCVGAFCYPRSEQESAQTAEDL